MAQLYLSTLRNTVVSCSCVLNDEVECVAISFVLRPMNIHADT